MSNDDDIEHAQRIRRCRSCSAAIIWLTTTSGKAMPVDADSVKADDTTFDHARHVSHFATCPNATHHRRQR
jgi:hypothetical protein